ncbi:fumarylacetoacetate hydrolase family protein [Paenibacillus protaetiae]|uniref:FAA hydrolase family protein n=1 Tax=Paenibacillus protaetiae TaxID=2509456 RepID=A0A4P6EU34_9BACL|nr:fumarylacetoacetate hydrolase family protein [Paenibacillus protaetiae]QAY66452.1 FAA hydrolase family protein [Paenibacillus protaetiae]
MKLATISVRGIEQAAVVTPGGYVLMETVNQLEGTGWSTDMFELVASGQLAGLTDWYNEGGWEALEGLERVALSEAQAAPLYRHPRKIWGIGMNYVTDPEELKHVPEGSEPVSFMKPDTTIIGPGNAIRLPVQSAEVTAEAELAIIIGKECRSIEAEEAGAYIAGYAAALDVTAADIHARNQRFLTRAKSFDTFFSFGSELLTADAVDDVAALQVETWHNGEQRHVNVISNMRYQPSLIVAFHSQVMTLLPGDVILTGTPGAVLIRDGDTVQCRISGGLSPLCNPVSV